jgi:hypothetical protein
MSKLISTKIPLLGPLSKLPIKSSLENETSSNFGGNDEVTAWEIKDEEIKIDYKAPLGNGAFATVYKVYFLSFFSCVLLYFLKILLLLFSVLCRERVVARMLLSRSLKEILMTIFLLTSKMKWPFYREFFTHSLTHSLIYSFLLSYTVIHNKIHNQERS